MRWIAYGRFLLGLVHFLTCHFAVRPRRERAVHRIEAGV